MCWKQYSKWKEKLRSVSGMSQKEVKNSIYFLETSNKNDQHFLGLWGVH